MLKQYLENAKVYPAFFKPGGPFLHIAKKFRTCYTMENRGNLP